MLFSGPIKVQNRNAAAILFQILFENRYDRRDAGKSRIFADKSRKIARLSTRLRSRPHRRPPSHQLVATKTSPRIAFRWIGSCTLRRNLQLSKFYWLRRRTALLRNTEPLMGIQPIVHHAPASCFVDPPPFGGISHVN